MTDAAIAAYGEVLAAEPGNVAAYRNLGEVLLASGRIDAYLENFRRFEARCPEALPLAVQALVACQHMGDFARLERYLDGLRRSGLPRAMKRSSSMRSRSFSTCCSTSTSSPSMLAQFAHTYDSVARHVYGEPLPPARGAPAGARAHRLPFRRPAQPRHGQDDVGSGRASR